MRTKNLKRKPLRNKRDRPVRGKSGLTRERVQIRSGSGLTHPVRGALGRQLAEERS
jgi:hypothetical protein